LGHTESAGFPARACYVLRRGEKLLNKRVLKRGRKWSRMGHINGDREGKERETLRIKYGRASGLGAQKKKERGEGLLWGRQ